MKRRFGIIGNRTRSVLGVFIALALAAAITSPAAKAATTEAARSGAYTSYYELLMTAVDEYGIGVNSSRNFLEGPNIFASQGVLYAELIDFDNNGVPELLYIYMDGSWASLYGEYWTVYGYSAGVECYFEELKASEGGGSREYGVVTDRSGVSYLHAAYTDYTGYEEITQDYYYTVKNEIWTEVPGEGLDIVSVRPMSGGAETVRAVIEEINPLQSDDDWPDAWAEADVNAAISAGLVPRDLHSGYTRATTRAEFCALAVALYKVATGMEITQRVTFIDTNDANVEKAAAIGVVNGVGGNKFDPDSKLTREQAATMLSRLADAVGKPLPKHSATFNDIANVEAYAIEAVGQMQASGIMGGTGDNMFSPKTDYQRQQSIVTMLRLYYWV